MSRPVYLVALTGGIGSGKSTVAGLFVNAGVPVIDADVIAHLLTAPGGAAINAIKQEFGAAMINPAGALDRARMRERVFAEPARKIALENILHPMIREQMDHAAAAAQGDGAEIAILAVPLLFETMSFRGRARRALVIDCSVELQRQRVHQRSGIAMAEIERIISSQVSRSMRLQLADDVISNSGDVTVLPAQVSQLHERYRALANE
ncbi:MAG: dephospho-CoA kinase [Betaproteobacteria bacterium]